MTVESGAFELSDVLQFFERSPAALPLYEEFVERLRADLGDGFAIRVQKTQIAFGSRFQFAFVSLPARGNGRPEGGVTVTFGLGRPVDHPRIAQKVEPYPGRWTHHVVVSKPGDLDDELMAWVAEAYRFSMDKRRRGGKR